MTKWTGLVLFVCLLVVLPGNGSSIRESDTEDVRRAKLQAKNDHRTKNSPSESGEDYNRKLAHEIEQMLKTLGNPDGEAERHVESDKRETEDFGFKSDPKHDEEEKQKLADDLMKLLKDIHEKQQHAMPASKAS